LAKKSDSGEVSPVPAGPGLQPFFIRSAELEAALLLAVQEEERSKAVVLLQACRSLCDKLAKVGYENIELDNNDLAALNGYQEVVRAGLSGDPKVVYHSGRSVLDMVSLAQLLAHYLIAKKSGILKSC
jgi:hypothetical protein